MTNAKSRLVRIIALALAVLMIVPMALVGCGKTDVDQAAIDAAIKEALDAAQKAQDAADKAAQDAKDAQDKLAEAEKEADKLQAEIDAMKNTTTAAPEVTTQAPTQDSTVVDAYIASILLDKESEYNKLVATYKAVKSIYKDEDQAAIDAAIDTAEIAIGRAATVDYANQLVAGLKAQLEAIPTFSERVKEAYDKIDFTSDVDVIDVAYAYALLDRVTKAEKKAEYDKDQTDAKLDKTELDAIVAADVKALTEFGADEINLKKAIEEEFARYTGANGLYETVYTHSSVATISGLIKALFANDGKFDVASIKLEADPAAQIKAIEKAYADLYKSYSKKDYAASLKEAFEIAFVGADYLLDEEGNFLQAKLAEAKTRAEELVAAQAEYNDTKALTNGTKGLKALTDKYGDDFIFADYSDKIVAVDTALTAWMNKYGFESGDDNLDYIIGDGVYAKFAEMKAVMAFVNEWEAKLATINAADIKDALESLNDDADVDDDTVADDILDYVGTGDAVKALYTWYFGTYKLVDKNIVANEDGAKDAKLTYKDAAGIVKTFVINDANMADMLSSNFNKLTVADLGKLETALEAFEGEGLLGTTDCYIKTKNEIIKKAGEVDFTATLKDIVDAINTIETDVANLCGALKLGKDDDGEYDSSSKNFDFIPFDKLEALEASEKALTGKFIEEAKKVVIAYIGWAGDSVEDGIAFDKDGEGTAFVPKTYDVEPVTVDVFSYSLISECQAIIDAIKDVLTVSEKFEIEDIEGEGQEFTTDDVAAFFLEMRSVFYYDIMAGFNDFAVDLKDHTIYNLEAGEENEWKFYVGGEVATLEELDDLNAIIAEKPAIIDEQQAIIDAQTAIIAEQQAIIDDEAATPEAKAAAEEAKAAAEEAKAAAEEAKAAATEAKAAAEEAKKAAEDQIAAVKHISEEEYNKLEELVTKYGKFGLAFKYPSDSKGVDSKDKTSIYVYGSEAGKGDDAKTYIDAILAVKATDYVIKEDGDIVDFDEVAYKAAVDAKIAEYRTTWYASYIKKSANTATINSYINKIITTAMTYGLFVVEGDFEMYGDAYTFVVDSSLAVTVKNEDGDVVTSVKDAEDVVYTLSAKLLGDKLVVNANYVVKEDGKDVTKTVLLSEVVDDKTANFEYPYSIIMTKNNEIGTIAKADAKTKNYAVLRADMFTIIADAYAQNEYYVARDQIINDAKSYFNTYGKKLPEEVKNDINTVYSEFRATWKDSKYGEVAIETIEVAYNEYIHFFNRVLDANGVAHP